MTTTALISRRAVIDDAVRPATLLIEHGRILEVRDGAAAAGADVVIDVGDDVMSPGLVDTHVHINEPGRTDWEGFTTATKAAAAGGVTTLVDMPLNCIPVTTTSEALAIKLAAAQGQLWVDVGFWGGVVPGNAEALSGLATAGALGCKAFLVHSGIDEFPDSDEATLRAAMHVLQAHGLPLLAHAEIDLGLGGDVIDGDPRSYDSYLRSRPAAWEDAAIALLIRLCRETGCAVHVVHLSSAGSLPQIREAKAEGLPLTVETCAHYLCLCAEHVPDGDTTYKCAPPIRDDHNRGALWAGLRDGTIDFVVTDHSPCTPALKGAQRGDFHEAWGGISSLQLGLGSVWSEASARGFGVEHLAAWMSERPARFAGLGHSKGRLVAGADADVLIWSPEATFEVTPDILQFRHKQTPYFGRTLRGVVRQTWLRGSIVYDAGVVADAPVGRPLLGRAVGGNQ